MLDCVEVFLPSSVLLLLELLVRQVLPVRHRRTGQIIGFLVYLAERFLAHTEWPERYTA